MTHESIGVELWATGHGFYWSKFFSPWVRFFFHDFLNGSKCCPNLAEAKSYFWSIRVFLWVPVFFHPHRPNQLCNLRETFCLEKRVVDTGICWIFCLELTSSDIATLSSLAGHVRKVWTLCNPGSVSHDEISAAHLLVCTQLGVSLWPFHWNKRRLNENFSIMWSQDDCALNNRQVCMLNFALQSICNELK